MSTRKSDFFKAFERAFDWFLVGGAVLLLIALSFAYFGIPPLGIASDEIREFAQSIISNLIPTILVFILAYVLLYRRIQRLRSEQETERLAGRVAEIVADRVQRMGQDSRLIERAGRNSFPLTDLDWLYIGEDVAQMEAQIQTEVWVVSPHLLNDTGSQYEGGLDGTSTIKVVQENLRRRVSYTFLVPDTDQIRMLLPQLRKNYSVSRNKLRVVMLPPDIFQALTIFEVVIYDPNLKSRQTHLVFMELTVPVAHDYWAKLNDSTAAAFVTRVRNVIREYPVS